MLFDAPGQIGRKSDFLADGSSEKYVAIDFSSQLISEEGRELVMETLIHRLLMAVTRLSDEALEKTGDNKFVVTELLLDIQVIAKDIMELKGIPYSMQDLVMKTELSRTGRYLDPDNLIWVVDRSTIPCADQMPIELMEMINSYEQEKRRNSSSAGEINIAGLSDERSEECECDLP